MVILSVSDLLGKKEECWTYPSAILPVRRGREARHRERCKLPPQPHRNQHRADLIPTLENRSLADLLHRGLPADGHDPPEHAQIHGAEDYQRRREPREARRLQVRFQINDPSSGHDTGRICGGWGGGMVPVRPSAEAELRACERRQFGLEPERDERQDLERVGELGDLHDCRTPPARDGPLDHARVGEADREQGRPEALEAGGSEVVPELGCFDVVLVAWEFFGGGRGARAGVGRGA